MSNYQQAITQATTTAQTASSTSNNDKSKVEVKEQQKKHIRKRTDPAAAIQAEKGTTTHTTKGERGVTRKMKRKNQKVIAQP